MQAFVIYLEEIAETKDSALKAVETCNNHGLTPNLFAGFTPERADDFLLENNIVAFSPGPKIFDIKNSKGGVRGCFASHYHVWKKAVELNETIVVMEHDARITREIPDIDIESVLHLDAWRFDFEPEEVENEIEEYYEVKKGYHTMKGAYAYMITPEAAAKLIQSTHDTGYCAADIHIRKENGIKIERIHPRCAIVSDTKSLTSDRNFYM